MLDYIDDTKDDYEGRPMSRLPELQARPRSSRWPDPPIIMAHHPVTRLIRRSSALYSDHVGSPHDPIDPMS